MLGETLKDTCHRAATSADRALLRSGLAAGVTAESRMCIAAGAGSSSSSSSSQHVGSTRAKPWILAVHSKFAVLAAHTCSACGAELLGVVGRGAQLAATTVGVLVRPVLGRRDGQL